MIKPTIQAVRSGSPRLAEEPCSRRFNLMVPPQPRSVGGWKDALRSLGQVLSCDSLRNMGRTLGVELAAEKLESEKNKRSVESAEFKRGTGLRYSKPKRIKI